MISIILCDDDRFILQLATERINEVISRYDLTAQVACVSTDSAEVLQYMKNNNGPYLVFLDLDLGTGKLNGIDVAKRIKSQEYAAKIVFATNHHEMAMKVLQSGVEPFGFLEKTTDLDKLSDGYRRYIQMAISSVGEVIEENESVELAIGIDETLAIQKNHILYIESEKSVSHGISYHTVDGSCITVRDTMEHILTELGEEFVRVHRSIIANRKHMVGLDGMNICLSNGERIPCAVRMRAEVKRWLN
ncbi:LytR/AlgR family response regulator transcription factor [Anaerosporobacter sp.]|uniref:LytR/AlgR family response regulator transcription factor n=1 Tax=Anaerosporobacter sp. TaxID=1872529 RepID=UPI00286F36D4|nr:LytTR family DNA-binding domain-containing protein [Anaerosporobacter sp.]